MNRRDFIRGGLLAGGALGAAGTVSAGGAKERRRQVVIDAHCHAGRGLNYGRSDPDLDHVQRPPVDAPPHGRGGHRPLDRLSH